MTAEPDAIGEDTALDVGGEGETDFVQMVVEVQFHIEMLYSD